MSRKLTTAVTSLAVAAAIPGAAAAQTESPPDSITIKAATA